MTIIMICFAAFLTVFSSHRKNILLSLCAGLTWFALFLWFFLGTPDVIFDLQYTWAKILCWVFLILTFLPFLFLMDTEITKERDGYKWTEWGARPRTRISNYEEYTRELKARVGRARNRR